MRTYFMMMSIRLLCVCSLFWVRGPWIILVGVATVALPYLAVLIANAVSAGQADTATPPTPLELEHADEHLPAQHTATSPLLVGEVLVAESIGAQP